MGLKGGLGGSERLHVLRGFGAVQARASRGGGCAASVNFKVGVLKGRLMKSLGLSQGE